MPQNDPEPSAAKPWSRALRELIYQTKHRERAREEHNNPFRLPEFPPCAVPPASSPRLAQDEAIAGVYDWAAGARNVFASAWAEGTTFMGYSDLSVLAQRAEYRIISEVIASEMTREWITLKSKSGQDKTEKIKAIDGRMKELQVKDKFCRVAELDGFFGRGHLYLDTGDTENPEELKKPLGNGRNALSRSKVSREHPLRHLQPVEPIWSYPMHYESTNPLKPDWYKPRTWYVMSNEVHESRLLTFIGRPVPDLLKPSYAFGGLAMSQMAKPYVDNWLRTRQSVADMVAAFSIMVLATDLQQLSGAAGADLIDRIELFDELRDNFRSMVVNKTSEELSNVSAPLSGLDALQAQTQEHMFSVSQIPSVKFAGIQPSGLNASSDGEIRVFYDGIKARQTRLFGPNLDIVLGHVQLSLFNEVDPDIGYDWVDLWQLDEEKEAAVQASKAQTHKTYVDMGAVRAAEVRQAIAEDKDSPYAGLKLGSLPPQPAPELPPQEGAAAGQPSGLAHTGEGAGSRPPFPAPRAVPASGGEPRPAVAHAGGEPRQTLMDRIRARMAAHRDAA